MRVKVEEILRMVETYDRKISREAFLILRSVVWDLEACGEVRKLSERFGCEIVDRMGLSDVDDVCEYLKEIGCGEVEVSVLESESDEFVMELGYDNVAVYDCISCCGAPEVGRTLCTLEGGLIQGMIGAIEGEEYHAIEYTCWGLGDRRCTFALVPKKDVKGCLKIRELVSKRAQG